MKFTFLGTTTLLFDDGTDQILFDAHFTRPSIEKYVVGAYVETNTGLCDRLIERHHIDRLRAIFVSHTHHDHVMDAPYTSFSGMVVSILSAIIRSGFWNRFTRNPISSMTIWGSRLRNRLYSRQVWEITKRAAHTTSSFSIKGKIYWSAPALIILKDSWMESRQTFCFWVLPAWPKQMRRWKTISLRKQWRKQRPVLWSRFTGTTFLPLSINLLSTCRKWSKEQRSFSSNLPSTARLTTWTVWFSIRV